MAPANFSFDTDVLPVVRVWAAKRFARHRDREAKLFDAESVAWEFHQAAPAAPPKAIAWYTLKRVASERHFHQSARSIDGPNPRKRSKPERGSVTLNEISRPGDDPAEIAAFRCDFTAWVKQLNDRDRKVAESLSQGNRTGEVAKTVGCSAGRISQIRRELAENWEAYTA